jgi:hypothetical protein
MMIQFFLKEVAFALFVWIVCYPIQYFWGTPEEGRMFAGVLVLTAVENIIKKCWEDWQRRPPQQHID